MYGNVVFVVWRESVEALLVVGILNAWLAANAAGAPRARLFLWGGVAAGLVVAALFGWALVALADTLSDTTQEAFRTAMVLVAAVLIVQMILWMRRHGRSLKRDLEGALGEAVAHENWWGVFTLAAIALAREGSETVVFLYGVLTAGSGDVRLTAAGAAVLGLIGALATYAALQIGARRLSWAVFFRATEVMLLLLACALLMTGIDGLIELDLLPKLTGRLWDTSAILPDGNALGGFLANLTGYRARPNLTELLAFLVYWGGVAILLRPARPRPASAA